MTATLVYSMIANFKVTPAFGAMFILLLAATVLFIYGTKRYIIRKVDWRANTLTLRAIIASLFCWKKDNSTDRVVACAPGFDKLKVSNGGWIKDDLVTAAFRLLLIVPVQGFFIPVNLGVQQFVMLMLPMSLSMNHPKMWSGTNMVRLCFLVSWMFILYYFNVNNLFLLSAGLRQLVTYCSLWYSCQQVLLSSP